MTENSIVLCKHHDWQGLYINRSLHLEGHSITAEIVLEAVQSLSPSRVIRTEHYDVDPQWFESLGGFPDNLTDVWRQY